MIRTPRLASSYKLEDLIGKRVKSLKDFSGIKTGTEGLVIDAYGMAPRHRGITIQWITDDGHVMKDGFGRDAEFDETQWLEVVDG